MSKLTKERNKISRSVNPEDYNLNNLNITPTSTKINPKYFLKSKRFPGSPGFNSSALRITPHPIRSTKKKKMRKSASVVDHFDQEIEH